MRTLILVTVLLHAQSLLSQDFDQLLKRFEQRAAAMNTDGQFLLSLCSSPSNIAQQAWCLCLASDKTICTEEAEIGLKFSEIERMSGSFAAEQWYYNKYY